MWSGSAVARSQPSRATHRRLVATAPISEGYELVSVERGWRWHMARTDFPDIECDWPNAPVRRTAVAEWRLTRRSRSRPATCSATSASTTRRWARRSPGKRLMAIEETRGYHSSIVATLPKSATGIDGFDQVTAGGLPTGRTTLICGGAGCGETSFVNSFALH